MGAERLAVSVQMCTRFCCCPRNIKITILATVENLVSGSWHATRAIFNQHSLLVKFLPHHLITIQWRLHQSILSLSEVNSHFWKFLSEIHLMYIVFLFLFKIGSVSKRSMQSGWVSVNSCELILKKSVNPFQRWTAFLARSAAFLDKLNRHLEWTKKHYGLTIAVSTYKIIRHSCTSLGEYLAGTSCVTCNKRKVCQRDKNRQNHLSLDHHLSLVSSIRVSRTICQTSPAHPIP